MKVLWFAFWLFALFDATVSAARGAKARDETVKWDEEGDPYRLRVRGSVRGSVRGIDQKLGRKSVRGLKEMNSEDDASTTILSTSLNGAAAAAGAAVGAVLGGLLARAIIDPPVDTCGGGEPSELENGAATTLNVVTWNAARDDPNYKKFVKPQLFVDRYMKKSKKNNNLVYDLVLIQENTLAGTIVSANKATIPGNYRAILPPVPRSGIKEGEAIYYNTDTLEPITTVPARRGTAAQKKFYDKSLPTGNRMFNSRAPTRVLAQKFRDLRTTCRGCAVLVMVVHAGHFHGNAGKTTVDTGAVEQFATEMKKIQFRLDATTCGKVIVAGDFNEIGKLTMPGDQTFTCTRGAPETNKYCPMQQALVNLKIRNSLPELTLIYTNMQIPPANGGMKNGKGIAADRIFAAGSSLKGSAMGMLGQQFGSDHRAVSMEGI